MTKQEMIQVLEDVIRDNAENLSEAITAGHHELIKHFRGVRDGIIQSRLALLDAWEN